MRGGMLGGNAREAARPDGRRPIREWSVQSRSVDDRQLSGETRDTRFLILVDGRVTQPSRIGLRIAFAYDLL